MGDGKGVAVCGVPGCDRIAVDVVWLGTHTGCRVCPEHRGDGETIAERYTRLQPYTVKLGGLNS